MADVKIEMERMGNFQDVALMLVNSSVMRADLLDLRWGEGRIREARSILAGGRDAPLWTYTRLLLKLSESEALAMGKLCQGMNNG